MSLPQPSLFPVFQSYSFQALEQPSICHSSQGFLYLNVKPLYCLQPKLMTKCTSQNSALENDPPPLSCRLLLSDAIRSFTIHTNILCQHIHEPIPVSFFLCHLILRKHPYHEQMVWFEGRGQCNRLVGIGILAICSVTLDLPTPDAEYTYYSHCMMMCWSAYPIL